MSDNGMKWYTIHVYSSMEKSVKKALEERIGRSDLRESFGQVLLPVERVQEVRNGRKYTSERRMYPGYVFIRNGDERRYVASRQLHPTRH